MKSTSTKALVLTTCVRTKVGEWNNSVRSSLYIHVRKIVYVRNENERVE